MKSNSLISVQGIVGCAPVATNPSAGMYELNLFFTQPIADSGVGDQIKVKLTATASSSFYILTNAQTKS